MDLQFDKNHLEDRIRSRSTSIFKRGMIEEAEKILMGGYAKTCPALSSFGYKEAVQVIEGTLPRSQFLPKLIKGTLAYAKRQRTWFRSTPGAVHMPVSPESSVPEVVAKVEEILGV